MRERLLCHISTSAIVPPKRCVGSPPKGDILCKAVFLLAVHYCFPGSAPRRLSTRWKCPAAATTSTISRATSKYSRTIEVSPNRPRFFKTAKNTCNSSLEKLQSTLHPYTFYYNILIVCNLQGVGSLSGLHPTYTFSYTPYSVGQKHHFLC